ncbi:hypothetical protein ThvES_00013490 [Thiovulum sp. ES]|nr:hypothetical protein ThvES_00013490 [Thiovulum sp. ES]
MFSPLIKSILSHLSSSVILAEIQNYCIRNSNEFDLTNISFLPLNDYSFKIQIYNWVGTLSYHEAIEKPDKLLSFIYDKHLVFKEQYEQENLSDIPKSDKDIQTELALQLVNVEDEAMISNILGRDLSKLRQIMDTSHLFSILDLDTLSVLEDISKRPTTRYWE